LAELLKVFFENPSNSHQNQENNRYPFNLEFNGFCLSSLEHQQTFEFLSKPGVRFPPQEALMVSQPSNLILGGSSVPIPLMNSFPMKHPNQNSPPSTQPFLSSTLSLTELPWDQPSIGCREYIAWKDNRYATMTPWSKLDTLTLAFIRKILVPNPEKRLQLDKIKTHKWCSNPAATTGNVGGGGRRRVHCMHVCVGRQDDSWGSESH
jgi:hypothetical protein